MAVSKERVLKQQLGTCLAHHEAKLLAYKYVYSMYKIMYVLLSYPNVAYL